VLSPRENTAHFGFWALKSRPANQIDRGRTVAEFIGRWRHRVVRRMLAHDDRRPVFDRRQFLSEFWADHPWHTGAVELADAFEAAIAAADGNPARLSASLTGCSPKSASSLACFLPRR
jgi:hypothetical protein